MIYKSPIGSIYHLYTTYSPCLLGDYISPIPPFLREPFETAVDTGPSQLLSFPAFKPFSLSAPWLSSWEEHFSSFHGVDRINSLFLGILDFVPNLLNGNPEETCVLWVFPKIVGFPPKSSNLIGFSIINHPFWGTPILGNPHINPYGLGLMMLMTIPFFAKKWGSLDLSTNINRQFLEVLFKNPERRWLSRWLINGGVPTTPPKWDDPPNKIDQISRKNRPYLTGSMWLVYSPTNWSHKNKPIHVGEYTVGPMDPSWV